VPFILVTGTVSEEFAAKIIKLGADDYILKDRLTRLPNAIEASLLKKKSEEIFRKQQELLSFKASLLAAVGQAVIATDMDGSVIYWNHAAETIFGWSAAEAMGRKVIDLTPSHENRGQATEIMEQLKKGNSWSGEFLVQRKDGSNFPAFVTDSPIYDKKGKMQGVIGVSTDITDRKNAEKELMAMEQQILNQKIQEQKKISRAIIKGQENERNHIGKELHDNINQILAGTKMYLSMAAQGNEVLKETLQYPIELINNTIEEIRILSSKQVTPLKNINLKKLIDLLIENLSRTSPIKTSFIYNITNILPDDDLKLNIYRIIQELVNNIIKHASSKNVSIRVEEKGNFINIEVADDGKGFDPAKERKGIGISNMINRIESFNGKIEIESSFENGCTVTISLPC
jgi:two-component system sensor histidine kinase UhpB